LLCNANDRLAKRLLDDDDVGIELTGATTVNTLQGPTLDQPLARNGRYFSANELGSTTMLTDGAGAVVQSYSYSPFGKVSQSTAESNPFQYAGRENDGTGLYYNRRRYYVPEWGRFLSEDPIGLAGGLNRYVYANNNPINGSDPSGLLPDLMAPFRWAFQKLVGLFGVRLTRGTPTFQSVYIPDELMDDSDIAAERNRFSPAGHAVSEFIDQTGALLLAQILMGAVQRALPEPVQNLPKHHIFPQRGVLSRFFRSRGIDIDAYALQLPVQVHRRIHAGGAFGGAWNAAWETWINANPNATVEEIARQAGRMIYEFGLDGYPLVRYK
jgi:RHS repeat-associated protein